MKTLVALSLMLAIPFAHAGGWTDLTVDSFKTATSKAPGNAAFSPYSFNQALKVLGPAVDAPTLEKIKSVLANEDTSIPTFKQAKFSSANALWMDHKIQARETFWAAMSEVHGQSAALDFSDTKNAAKNINGWAERSTQGLIPKIIDPKQLDGIQVLLANAVAIDAKWLGGGELDQSKDTFHGVKKKATGVFLTAPELSRPYVNADHTQFVEIEMAEGEVVLGLLVPDADQKFADWKKALNAEKIRQWSSSAKATKLMVKFPAFDVRGQIDIKPLLVSLGLGSLFETGSRFPGLAEKPPLKLGWAKQDVYFSTDKNGVKAGAVTSMSARVGTGGMPPKIVSVDRPFLYFLTDKQHSHILFIGQKTEP